MTQSVTDINQSTLFSCSVRSPQWLRGKWWSMKRHIKDYHQLSFPGSALAIELYTFSIFLFFILKLNLCLKSKLFKCLSYFELEIQNCELAIHIAKLLQLLECICPYTWIVFVRDGSITASCSSRSHPECCSVASVLYGCELRIDRFNACNIQQSHAR